MRSDGLSGSHELLKQPNGDNEEINRTILAVHLLDPLPPLESHRKGFQIPHNLPNTPDLATTNVTDTRTSTVRRLFRGSNGDNGSAGIAVRRSPQ